MFPGSPSRRRIVALAATGLTLLAVPAGASAVTVTLDHTCYTHIPTKGSQPIVATITGGTPNANFILAATVPGKGTGSAGSTEGTFDAAGNAIAQITDVFPPSGSIDPLRGQPVNLSIQDFSAPNPPDVPVGKALITNLAITVADTPRSPRKHRRVSVSGTPFAGKKLFGFVTKPKSNHVLRRFYLGRGNVCGYASSKEIVGPPSGRTGNYRLYVNAGPKLDKPLSISYGFRIFTTTF